MIELITRTKSWGNSVGVLLPKKLGFKEEQEVHLHIELPRPVTKVKDIFGKLPIKKSTKDIMKELREELDAEL